MEFDTNKFWLEIAEHGKCNWAELYCIDPSWDMVEALIEKIRKESFEEDVYIEFPRRNSSWNTNYTGRAYLRRVSKKKEK